VVLSLIGPGFGHFYLDDPKRAAAWLSCHIVLVLAMNTGIHFGWPLTLFLVLPALLLVRLAAGLCTLQSSRPTHLPRVPTALATRHELAVLDAGGNLVTP
jgi:hypothetical protein